MILGQTFKHQDEVYTVLEIGPLGTGKFWGKQIVDLRRERDGQACYAQVKNGRLAWNSKVSERRAS